MAKSILDQVRLRIDREALSADQAAAQIGVTTQSLARHLSGDYARSDSLAKYRLWLGRDSGDIARRAKPNKTPTPVPNGQPSQLCLPVNLWEKSCVPQSPHTVVDVFSGCGGLSLGFERLENGALFRTTLALDIEEPMVRVFNDNHPQDRAELTRGRQIDLTDFLNETEIRVFYLDHLARSGQDLPLLEELRDLGGYDLYTVRANLRILDRAFLERLAEIRADGKFAGRFRSMGDKVLSQTSVIAFHRSLKLPMTALGAPRPDTLLWSGDGSAPESPVPVIQADKRIVAAKRKSALSVWRAELHRLEQKCAGSGKGQLSSAAKRISLFVDFASSPSMAEIRREWADWRATRDAIRTQVFDDKRVKQRVEKLYQAGRRVSVLLGGPPCQGFSRIGRGKIRSLREQRVHVHEDEDSVDSRNQLLEQYVLFVSALAPRVFLFENVRHFQAKVRIDKMEFDASQTLADAIRDVAANGLSYNVASRIVDASAHLIPQVRERYLMVGLRSDVAKQLTDRVTPDWCLDLPVQSPIPLAVPLQGLPEPAESGDLVRVTGTESHLGEAQGATRLLRWICANSDGVVDSHIARPPRRDDALFFASMGPGRRWMDYRCDGSRTLGILREFVSTVHTALKKSPSLARKLNIETAKAKELKEIVDGSLSLRLLLETIPPLPGETEHHLLSANYLKKKDGQHGDWLSRMDATKPSKTIVSHMAKDTYAYVHPTQPRTISARESARIQTFPDSYKFRSVGLIDAFRMIGNAVPPLLSAQFADRIAQVLWALETGSARNEKSQLELRTLQFRA